MPSQNEPLPKIAPRLKDANKGDFGKIAVVAGSVGMSGAACLAALAALRAGAGLVTLAVPKRIQPVVASQMMCVMTRGLPDTTAGTFSMEGLEETLEFCAGMDAVAVGPGMGRVEDTLRFARALYEKLDRPVVFDADALFALAADEAALKKFPAGRPTVLTPHPGEMARLLSTSAGEVQRDREMRKTFAAKHGVVMVLKGAGTVATDGRLTHTNVTGNPGMATAGSGDVLTGVIAALLGQYFNAFDAARLGVHVHGLAGDIAAAAKGEIGMIATDILDALPEAFMRLAARRTR